MFLRFLLITTILFLAGCGHRGATLENLNDSLAELQRIIIHSLPAGKRSQSVSARQFTSEYFVVREGIFLKNATASERRYAVISIYGERRPYSIVVEVPVEVRRSNGKYELDRHDQALARVLLRRIQKALAERREDRNIIDDFRVF